MDEEARDAATVVVHMDCGDAPISARDAGPLASVISICTAESKVVERDAVETADHHRGLSGCLSVFGIHSEEKCRERVGHLSTLGNY